MTPTSSTLPTFPTLGAALAVSPNSRFIPAALIAQKAKAVSDGIVAALELRSTVGDEARMGVMPWLIALHREAAAGPGAEWLAAAIELGQTGTTTLPAAQSFLQNPLRSKAISFYTWNADLAHAFVRDRYLQEPLPAAVALELARALSRCDPLVQSYREHLRRVARLTDRLSSNPPSLVDVKSLNDGTAVLVPTSQAIENDFGTRAAFFAAVRSGRCDLTPASDSGFYAHQRATLRALLAPNETPEATARTINDEYADALERLAGLSFFFGRETHVKQLEVEVAMFAGRPATKIIVPGLTVEPVPSFYRLTASAFRFLRTVIEESWGDAALEMPQQRASGRIDRSVGQGINDVITLCDAAEELSRRELDGTSEPASLEALRARLPLLRSDDDVTGDARGMVPLSGVDPETGMLRACAFVGWQLRPLEARIVAMPDKPKDTAFGTERHAIPVPIVVDIAISPTALLDRDEFRAACDARLRNSPM